MSSEIVLQVRNISKTFGAARVLDDVTVEIRRGEMVGLIGPSGSGKSTLIRAIAGLTSIDQTEAAARAQYRGGEIRLFAQPIQRHGRVVRSANTLRVRVGIVFQQFNLVPRLSVLTNVCLGLLGRMPLVQATCGHFTLDQKRRAMRALARVGIADHALKRGCDLSGGQQQRAAIARALVQGAEFIVADEPIASLDPNSARRVMDILADLNRQDGITVLISLHQVDYALRYCPRAIALKAGAIVYDGGSSALTSDLLCSIYGAESDDLFASIDASPLPSQHLVKANRAVTEREAKSGARIFDLPPRPRPDSEHAHV